MDLQRYALLGATAAISFMLLTKWSDFQTADQLALAAQQAPPPAFAQNGDDSLPTQGFEQLADLPSLSSTSAQVDTPNNLIADTKENASVSITTDLLNVVIDLRGGDLSYIAFPEHYAKIDTPDQPFVLLENFAQRTYIAQSGLLTNKGVDIVKGRPLYNAQNSSYFLSDDQQTLSVDLTFQTEDQVTITKRFTFTRGSYTIGVEHLVSNGSSTPWTSNFFAQIKRDSSEDPGSEASAMGMQPYLGFATTLPDSPFEKIDFEDMRESSFKADVTGGWIAMVQHYFLSAWIPNPEQTHHYSTAVTSSGMNIARFTSPAVTVNAGEINSVANATFYAGPKDQYKLEKLSPNLELSVDYGWLWWIAQPLFAILFFLATGELHIFGWSLSIGFGFGNWGVSIILLTVLIKAMFFKLSATSYRSMAKMKKLAPKMAALKEQHGDDRQKMSQATMEMYKKEKVNPLGGCLPILVQMPVFIALYWTLMESVELRHAPFFLWISDLSVKDPYFVLPLIMGASMFFQQKLNPPPPDPMQAKVMQMMPIFFTFFFLFFPAGLVLYWVVNNLLSMAQQFVITKQIEKAS